MRRRLRVLALLAAPRLAAIGLTRRRPPPTRPRPGHADQRLLRRPATAPRSWAAANPATAARPPSSPPSPTSRRPTGSPARQRRHRRGHRRVRGRRRGARTSCRSWSPTTSPTGTSAPGQSSGGAARTPPTTPGSAPSRAASPTARPLVILEPDALADESCMTSAEISDRDGLLNNAITQFTNQAPDTWVYLDAGNPGWISAATMASYLNAAGPGPCPRLLAQRLQLLHHRPERRLRRRHQRRPQRRLRLHQAVRHRHQPQRQRLQRQQWCNPAGASSASPTSRAAAPRCCCGSRRPASPTATAAPATAPPPVQFVPQLAYDLVYGY